VRRRVAGPPPKWTIDKIEPNYGINVKALLIIPLKFDRACMIRRSTLSNTMHYKWESAYSLQMNISLSVIALTVSVTAILVLSGAGTHSSVETVYAQVNVLPGTEETANTTSTAPTAGLRFNAADIAQTNSMKLDSDVHNLVVLIPDKRLVNQGFLPLDATIVEGTKVIWSNADNSSMSPQGNPHGIELVQDSDNQVLLSNGSIPFKNGVEFTFDTAGTYTFSDPTNTDPAAPKGKINVVAPGNAPDNLSTNTTQATAGLFVVQAEDKDYFDMHFNTLGYHVEDSYMIPGPDGNDIQVYVYTQKSGKYPTIIDRTGLKAEFVNTQIVED
jgi:plastocyanin